AVERYRHFVQNGRGRTEARWGGLIAGECGERNMHAPGFLAPLLATSLAIAAIIVAEGSR
ncbi:MAG: hypothetical protein E6562_13075, partial [Pantoea sp.]|uniref:hypothetical protein n=1 Tax=Pantoea sp. TaxID=69393 RepID=UPI00290AEEBE